LRLSEICPSGADLSEELLLGNPFIMSNAPSSQLAWLSSLTTGFNDFTPEQKFLRKVSPTRTNLGEMDSCCRDEYCWRQLPLLNVFDIGERGLEAGRVMIANRGD
jgi:hypothetical protein